MPATELAVGGSLGDGRYRLRQMLGTGGMASVWLGDDTRLCRPVAIKVPADSLALDSDYVCRFEREALVAARLSHPNLVGIFDFSAEVPRPYLVMEYVAGGTLAGRLRVPRREDWDAETVFRQLMSALEHVHAAGIIHRDIKPGNVLIGLDGRSRLTDFGIARPSDAEPLTQTGLVVGTARYLAPEIMRGRQPNERSDLYACGVLLADCLRDSKPPHLRRLAHRLTSEQPEDRPASATEVLELLDRPVTVPTAVLAANTRTTVGARTVGARTVGARTVGARSRLYHAGLRRTRSAIAIGSVVIALLVVLIVLATGASGGRRPASSPRVAAPPASAALSVQLDYLDRVIARARR